MTSKDFKVQTEVFDGPLELLLTLIEDKKLHISEISLAQVADDYIEYISREDAIPTASMAHFVLVASTLVLIKSKALLPTLELSSEEESDITELEYRLQVYKIIKDRTTPLHKMFGKKILFLHQERDSGSGMFVPDNQITQKSIRDSIGGVINEFPVVEKLSTTVVEKVMSLEDMIRKLQKRVQRTLRAQFSEIVESDASPRERKLAVAVTFLALLELVKQQQIAMTQASTFSDITIDQITEKA